MFTMKVVTPLILALACSGVFAQRGPAGPAPAATPKPKANSAATAPGKQQKKAGPKPAKYQPSENAEWEKTLEIEDTFLRIEALGSFIEKFPKSKRLGEARKTLAELYVGAGNLKLAERDPAAALAYFRKAIQAAPEPMPDSLFDEAFALLPQELFFRGEAASAMELAAEIESRIKNDVSKLLRLAEFYLVIENGSETRRIALDAIDRDDSSAAGYQLLGLANRLDFMLEESAVAFQKAVERSPRSTAARRGLAEAKRSLGKADEAVAIYRSILADEPENAAAATGLVLALLESGPADDAEKALNELLERTPTNVILMGTAAYIYAAKGEAAKAERLALRAIAAEPRFIWSHIALGRALTMSGKPLEAERTLLAARRFGNFPTLSYEIAVARASAGLYRDAAEELANVFTFDEGLLRTRLGGRISYTGRNFIELLSPERSASIFTSAAPDTEENAGSLAALLRFHLSLNAPDVSDEVLVNDARSLAAGSDPMATHRKIFAASQLLERRRAVNEAAGLVRDAVAGADRALDVPDAWAAVFASELYEPRRLALQRGEFLNPLNVPRSTLSAILRGRIEDLMGWGALENGDTEEAILRLRRAVGILPADSAWWRQSMWRLGTALAVAGKNDEALDAYAKSYKSSGASALRYKTIAALYLQARGTLDGLEDLIGPNPSPDPAALPADDPSGKPPSDRSAENRDAAAENETGPDNAQGKDARPDKTSASPNPSEKAGGTGSCTIILDEDSITLKRGRRSALVTMRTDDRRDVTDAEAFSPAADDVSAARWMTPSALRDKAVFVISANGSAKGEYYLEFRLPCGRKELKVTIE